MGLFDAVKEAIREGFAPTSDPWLDLPAETPKAPAPATPKHAPDPWAGLIGWAELKAYLAAVKDDPSWTRDVFALIGPSGIGKTTAAKMIAAELGYDGDPDVPLDYRRDNLWLDAGKVPKVEAIRELERRLMFGTRSGRWRVVIIDEAHNLRKEAKRALLGMLERLPAKTLIIFTAVESAWLEHDGGALRRRMKVFEAEGFTVKEILPVLREKKNGAQVGARTLKSIAEAARGNLGQALDDLVMVIRTGQLPLGLRRRLPAAD